MLGNLNIVSLQQLLPDILIALKEKHVLVECQKLRRGSFTDQTGDAVTQ